jgi:hypothetical protein
MSLKIGSYMEPRWESDTGELGTEPMVSVIAWDQRCELGTLTDVWLRIAAVDERSSCGGGSKCVGVRLKRFFLGRRDAWTLGRFLVILGPW